MTTTESVRLRLGDLVRDSCSHVTCAYHGRVGVLMRDTGLMWPVDFGDGIEWCWPEVLTLVKRGAA